MSGKEQVELELITSTLIWFILLCGWEFLHDLSIVDKEAKEILRKKANVCVWRGPKGDN